MTGKHHTIVVFSKLLSFKSAHESVRKSLKMIIDNDERLRNRVEVIDHSKYPDRSPSFPVCTVTAVVVIDARQTRTLITPHRRDPNVDHWQELEMLQNTITKPKGSILLVIYGDENSKHLRTELLSEKWKMVWKFNDELAFSLASKNRCFSVWENFNEGQRKEITRYIQLLPLIPVYKGKTRLAVLTEAVSHTIHDDYLAYHSLLSPEIRQKERRSDGLTIHSVFDLTFDSHSERRERIEVHHKQCDDISELLQDASSETQADKKLTDMQPCDVCVVMCAVSYYYKHGIDTEHCDRAELDRKLKNAVAKIFHLDPSNMRCRLMPVSNDKKIDYFKNIFIPFLERSFQNTIWQTEKLNCLDTLSFIDLQMICGLHKCYKTKVLDCMSEKCCGQCIALLGEVSEEKHRTLQVFVQNLGSFDKEEVTAGQSQTMTVTPGTIYRGRKLTIFDFTVKDNGQEHKYDENFLRQISDGKIFGSKKKPSTASQMNLSSIRNILKESLSSIGRKLLSTRNCAEIQAIVYVRRDESGCDESLRIILEELRRKVDRIPVFLFYESALADGKSKDNAKDNAGNKRQLIGKVPVSREGAAVMDAENIEKPTENVAATSAVENDTTTDNQVESTGTAADTSAGAADIDADNNKQPTENGATTSAVENDTTADNQVESTGKAADTSAGAADRDAGNKEELTDKVAATFKDDGDAENKPAATREGEVVGDTENHATGKAAGTLEGKADSNVENPEQPTEKAAAARSGKADGDVCNKEQPAENMVAAHEGDTNGNTDVNKPEKCAEEYYDFLSMNFSFVLNDPDEKGDENFRALYEVLDLSKEFYDSHRE